MLVKIIILNTNSICQFSSK